MKKKLMTVSAAAALVVGGLGVGATAANAAPASGCITWTEHGGSGYASCLRGWPFKVEIECRQWSLLMGWQHYKVQGEWTSAGGISQAHCRPGGRIFENRIIIHKAR